MRSSERANGHTRAVNALNFDKSECPARSMLKFQGMRAAGSKAHRYKGDFYKSTLAPVGRRIELRCCGVDIVMLTVLFLEVAALVRLFLAK